MAHAWEQLRRHDGRRSGAMYLMSGALYPATAGHGERCTLASLSLSTKEILLPTARECCISSKHQQRLSGIGSSHGAAIMHVAPMLLMPLFRVDCCQMSGSSGVRCQGRAIGAQPRKWVGWK